MAPDYQMVVERLESVVDIASDFLDEIVLNDELTGIEDNTPLGEFVSEQLQFIHESLFVYYPELEAFGQDFSDELLDTLEIIGNIYYLAGREALRAEQTAGIEDVYLVDLERKCELDYAWAAGYLESIADIKNGVLDGDRKKVKADRIIEEMGPIHGENETPLLWFLISQIQYIIHDLYDKNPGLDSRTLTPEEDEYVIEESTGFASDIGMKFKTELDQAVSKVESIFYIAGRLALREEQASYNFDQSPWADLTLH